jgi:ribosomal protein S13
VRVPDEAASTKCKVTISFPDWKGMNIAASTFELAVIDISPEQEAKELSDQQVSFERVIRLLRQQVNDSKDGNVRERLESEIQTLEKQLEELKKNSPTASNGLEHP